LPQAGFERIVLSNGKEANIPVDKDGYVPVESLIKRFNFVVEQGHVRNRPKDYDEHASVVLPIKMTPREAAAWWVSPNSYDVEYIDAPGKAHYNVSGIKDQDLQGVHKKIGIVCPPHMEKEVRTLINEAYPKSELKKLVADGPITVTVRPLEESAGDYWKNKINLDMEHGLNNSTVVHEGLHHMRMVDKDRRGPITRAQDIKDKNSMVIEESCTVAEQMARGKDPSSGYYQFVQIFDENKKRWRYPTEKEALDMMREDRALFTKGTNKPLSGRDAIESVEQNWSRSNISRLKLPGTKSAISAMSAVTGSIKAPTKPRAAQGRSNKSKSAAAKKKPALSEKKHTPKKQAAKKKTSGRTSRGKQTRRK